MGLISLSLPSDGTTADVADVNTPFNTIATAINGNLDNNNIKASAGINTSKLASDGFLTAWQSWTPTWSSSGSAPALGNGTIAGSYIQIGKTVKAQLKLTVGSTSTIGTGNYFFTLPVTSIALSGSSSTYNIIGTGTFIDNSSGWQYPLLPRLGDTTHVGFCTPQTFSGANPVYTLLVDSGSVIGSSTVASADIITLDFIYQAA